MKERSIETIRIDGGCLIFNFINTVNTRVEEDYFEYLSDYQEFMNWCRKVEMMEDSEIKLFRKYSQEHPEEAAKALEKLIKTREMLFDFFDHVITDSKPDENLIAKFNTVLSGAISHLSIDQNLNWSVLIWPDDLTSPLNRILFSAYEVLWEKPIERIKKCDACAWLFLDTTKNGKRRYCSPETCGSNEKAKRYYYRKKAERK